MFFVRDVSDGNARVARMDPTPVVLFAWISPIGQRGRSWTCEKECLSLLLGKSSLKLESAGEESRTLKTAGLKKNQSPTPCEKTIRIGSSIQTTVWRC
jgi:hypothetical protein